MIKDIDHIIKLRRAIYPNMFTGKKLSKSLIEKVIENSIIFFDFSQIKN